MTPEAFTATAGLLLSLGLSYLPFVKGLYDPLPNPQKVTVTGILLVIVAAGTLGYNCRADPSGLTACVSTNWQGALSALVAALVANQATYTLLVKPFKKAA